MSRSEWKIPVLGFPIRSFAAAGMLLPLAALAGLPLEARDDTRYSRMVMLNQVEIVPSKGKPEQKTLEIHFDLVPELPKDVKIEFELEYLSQGVDRTTFTLKDENRKGLKLTWTPKVSFVVDRYYLWTRIPMDQQAAGVVKTIEAKDQVFPKDQAPWPWYHMDVPIEVGTEEDKAAEKKMIQELFMGFCDKLITLNNEFIESAAEVKKGEKFINGGKLEIEEYTKFVADSMKRMAEVQVAIENLRVEKPLLVKKIQALHFNLQELGRMVAKRCYRQELREVLEKYGNPTLKLPVLKDLDTNYRFSTAPAQLGVRYERISKDLEYGWEKEEVPPEPKPEEEETPKKTDE